MSSVQREDVAHAAGRALMGREVLSLPGDGSPEMRSGLVRGTDASLLHLFISQTDSTLNTEAPSGKVVAAEWLHVGQVCWHHARQAEDSAQHRAYLLCGLVE
jgi:hypothetical protein